MLDDSSSTSCLPSLFFSSHDRLRPNAPMVLPRTEYYVPRLDSRPMSTMIPHSPTLPVDTLPPELLIEIFAVSAFQEALAPLILRRVSKWWREVVNSSPRVWQYIFLDDGVRSVECSRTQAELWTQRSVPLPIDIELNVESLDMVLPMLSPLLPSVDRWRSFEMKGKREESMVLTGLSMTRESLDCLQIAIQDDDVGLPKTTFTPEWPHNFTMNVWLLELPRSQLLAPLRFTSITITENPLSDIHTPPGSILDFLTACPELETFYFSGWQHNDEPPRTILPVVSLPNLHTLHLKNTCLARSVLSFLYVPRLANLYLAHLNVEFTLLGEYHEDGDSDDDAQDFSQSPWSDRATGMGLRKLISRSRPPIKLLDMDFSDMRTKDFRYVFDRLPLLEDFLIVASDMSDKVIDMLRPYRMPGPDNTIQTRLPRLRRIGLYNCQRLTGDAIVGALTARIEHTDVDPSGSLDEVAIVACDGFSHRNGEMLASRLGNRLRSLSNRGVVNTISTSTISPSLQNFTMFTTSRLNFRAYRSTDIDNLLLLYNDPLVATYITEDFVVPRHVDNFDKIMQMVKNSVMFCIVEEEAGGAFVGWSAILPMSDAKNRNATFGLAFLPNFWRMGYGMEAGTFLVDYAFRCLAMHRVSLTVFEGNDRAIALYKRLGFVEEGRHRQIVWIDGGWKDTIFMGILEDEWVILKRKRQEKI